MKSIKCLLGVRSQTTSDIVLLESGYPPIKAVVKSRQQKFFINKICERSNMTDDPFIYALQMTQSNNPSMNRYIESLRNGGDFIAASKAKCVERIRSAPPARSKLITYGSINPSLEVHRIYQPGHEPVDEYLRISFTRFRTSSHRLKIEPGRWARIPRERRLCQCEEGIQTEEHVIMHCRLTNVIKARYGFQHIESFESFMNGDTSKPQLLMIHEILNLLER